MRLFGLSCPLPDPACHPVPFRGSLGASGTDVVLWHPAGSVAEYSEQFEKPGGSGVAPLLTLAGTEAFLVDERRQRDALNRLLREGGIVVVDLAGAARLRIHTVEQIFQVDLAAVLPYPGASVFAPHEAVAEGVEVQAGQPFRAFAETVIGGAAAAEGLERHPGNVLVASAGGQVLGYYAGIGAGYLVALPIGLDDLDAARAARLVSAIERLAGAVGRVRHGLLPRWVDEVLPPEERALRDDAAELAQEMERLRRRGRDLALAREKLRKRRELVFARGGMLEDAVSDALRASDAAILQGRDGESSLVVERLGRIYTVDIHEDGPGASPESIAAIAEIAARESARAGKPVHPVLIDAGEQEMPPAERARPPFGPEALDAARTHGVTLLTTVDLLAMSRRGPDLDGDAWPDWLGTVPRPQGLPTLGWLG